MVERSAFLGGWVRICVGDIVESTTDAIVNAANAGLQGGSGVDGAIHAAGGPTILEECRRLRQMRFPEGLPVGDAVATTAGNLFAKWVIHTVGPVYGEWQGREGELLRACYWNSLSLARNLGAATVAFPAISTGAFRFPMELSALVVSHTLIDIKEAMASISRVDLIFHSDIAANAFISHAEFPV
ncbi:MAG TPA: macro domain-containing protein [Fibrobacteraceae bacterium]|nr:macro domain-containing protein [Fibrobacteraceae bacterium]